MGNHSRHAETFGGWHALEETADHGYLELSEDGCSICMDIRSHAQKLYNMQCRFV